MNNKEAKYLLEVYKPVMNKSVLPSTKPIILEAERILTGARKIISRGCSCQHSAMAQRTRTLFKEWEKTL